MVNNQRTHGEWDPLPSQAAPEKLKPRAIPEVDIFEVDVPRMLTSDQFRVVVKHFPKENSVETPGGGWLQFFNKYSVLLSPDSSYIKISAWLDWGEILASFELDADNNSIKKTSDKSIATLEECIEILGLLCIHTKDRVNKDLIENERARSAKISWLTTAIREWN